MQRPPRRAQNRQPPASRIPLGPALGILAIFLLIAAVVVISRVGQSAGPVAASATRTPTVPAATPIPTPPGPPTDEPTPPTAGFTLTDRCITTTTDAIPGPTRIRRGGLDLEVEVRTRT